MNEKQKQRAIAALGMWHSSNDASLLEYRAAELMAGLLQELADAPEVLTATNPAQISSLEPAPSAPDVNLEPSKEQLTQLINGVGKCFTKDSVREFLRVWVRDWTAHKLAAQQTFNLVRDAERYRWLRTYNTAKHPAVTEAFFLGDENLDAEIDAAIAAEKAPHDHRHTTTARAGNESVIGGLEMTTAPKNARYWQRRALRAEAELNLLRQRLGRDLDAYRDHVSELIDLRFRVCEAIDTLKGIEK